jgi:hypothetical protein
MLANKELHGRKHGRQLIIDIEAGLAFIETLPEAQIRPRKPRKRRDLPPAGPITPEMVADVVKAGAALQAEQPAERPVKRGKRAS